VTSGESRVASKRTGKSVVAGYVLAGGASSRFGQDKALVEIGGQTVLSRMCGLIAEAAGSVAVVAASERYPDLQLKIVEDRWPGEGPLGGIITALAATAQRSVGSDWNLIVSCDMPFLTRDWLSHMIERTLPGAPQSRSLASLGMTNKGTPEAANGDPEVIVPRSEHGLEPLCACWRTSSVETLQSAFDEGVRKVTEAMKRLRMEVLDETHWKRFDSAGRLFWNMNTQQDYQEALRVWETEKA